MKIFLTGAEGYIGSILMPFLEERGHAVTGFDAGFYVDRSLYETPKPRGRQLRGDTRRLAPPDLKGFDAVIHLAELSNDTLGQLNPQTTVAINHQGSLHVARTAKMAGVARFVHSSSCSLYGASAGDARTEESPVNPQTAYAECKSLVERDVGALADESFSPVFLRSATAFGISPRMRFDLVLNNLSGLAWTTHVIKMTSDGMPWRPLVHVKDISLAMALAVEAPREAIHGQIFNVGDNAANYQVHDIAEIVAGAFEGCALSFGSSDGDSRSYRVQFNKIRRHLPSFSCTHTAETGAHELRELFERIGMTREVFAHRAFTRLKQLQYLMSRNRIDGDLFWRQPH
jgi:nucleoside-diphosphate-sugar epimerase